MFHFIFFLGHFVHYRWSVFKMDKMNTANERTLKNFVKVDFINIQHCKKKAKRTKTDKVRIYNKVLKKDSF